MRNFIIGLSILFFALSGFITFKALGISASNARYQNNPQGLKSKEHLNKSDDFLKEVRVLAVLGGGTFRSGQVVINENLMNTIKELVRDISASPDHRVIIEGHTDNMPIILSPGRRYIDNMDLSFLRAKAIANILAEQGISLERISVIGYGDTRPIAANETDEGRAKNRRVEVKLIPEDKEF
jgi:outer membrane protein OmpA-like peptidoglycan-associated protein